MKYWFEKLGLVNENYQNELIPTGTGIIFLFPVIFGWYLLLIYNIGQAENLEIYIFLSIIICLSGFLDDLAGDKENQGFTGHFHKLFFDKKLTTGSLKALISLTAVSLIILEKNVSFHELIIDIGLILMMTNFLNLLDLRPGRAIKFFILSFIFLLIIIPFIAVYFIPLIVLIPYLFYELKGKVMMGDAGANLLGVILGYSFSLWTNTSGKMIIALLLLFLNLISEKVSFTDVISNNYFLDWLDRIGRK